VQGSLVGYKKKENILKILEENFYKNYIGNFFFPLIKFIINYLLPSITSNNTAPSKYSN
jgi:hypothetical protein